MTTAHAGPSLVFSKFDLPMLRERVKTGEFAAIWEDILRQARDCIDPKSPGYADAEQIDDVSAPKAQLMAATLGRRLNAWLESLGFAYQLTGDERFARHGIGLLTAAARGVPVSNPRIARSFPGGRGCMARAFAVGLDWLGEAMAEDEMTLIRQVGADYVRAIVAESEQGPRWMPYHNWQGVVLGGAGCLALKLRGVCADESEAWIREAARVVGQWFDNGFDAQGAYFEGTMYLNYGMWGGLFFADALLRSGGENLFERRGLSTLAHFYAMSLLPGETVFDAQNDANYGGYTFPFMLRLAGAYESGLAKWLYARCRTHTSAFDIIWANDVAPVDPVAGGEPLQEHFAGRGLCIFRTGWENSGVMFSLESGRFYDVTHNQADKGHFTFYGLGYRWAIDSGYGNTQEPEGRAQTVAHNCILIDGKGQALSGAGIGTNGEILAYESHDRYGYVLADASEAYNHNSRGASGVGVAFARRHALFIRPTDAAPAYVVILDEIRKDEETHEYTWLLHTDAGMTVDLKPWWGAMLTPPAPEEGGGSQAHMKLAVHASAALELELDDYDGHPRIKATTRAVQPDLAAVLLPLPAGMKTPDVVFEDGEERLRITIGWPQRRDVIEWPRVGSPSVVEA